MPQINLRITERQHAKLLHNAHLLDKKPNDYLRSLLEKEDELITGEDAYRRAIASVKRLRAAGRLKARRPSKVAA